MSWKSPRQLIVMLIETVSKGGNLLLNVGPTGRGTFDDRALERLSAMGDWMRLQSRSIYGCTAAPAEFPKPDNCLLTYNAKAKRLYVHVLTWPMGQLAVGGLKGKVAYAQLLNDASEVRFSDFAGQPAEGDPRKAEGITLNLPLHQPNTAIPVIELFLK